MTTLALSGWILFVALGVGWRTWLQWRRTGDSGLRVGAHALGSPEQIVGGALFAGGVLSIASPVLVAAGVLGTSGALVSPVIVAPAVVLVAAGIAITVKAQLDMGASWRIGVDRAERTDLATEGLYRFTRNPIYTGMLLVWVGEALLVPNLVSLAGLVVTFVAIEVFVRRVEEPHLVAVHGESYRAYARDVGRFLPGLGRIA